jgi:hypothetical protein
MTEHCLEKLKEFLVFYEKVNNQNLQAQVNFGKLNKRKILKRVLLWFVMINVVKASEGLLFKQNFNKHWSRHRVM